MGDVLLFLALLTLLRPLLTLLWPLLTLLPILTLLANIGLVSLLFSSGCSVHFSCSRLFSVCFRLLLVHLSLVQAGLKPKVGSQWYETACCPVRPTRITHSIDSHKPVCHLDLCLKTSIIEQQRSNILSRSETVLNARRLSTGGVILLEFSWDTTGFPTGGAQAIVSRSARVIRARPGSARLGQARTGQARLRLVLAKAG